MATESKDLFVRLTRELDRIDRDVARLLSLRDTLMAARNEVSRRKAPEPVLPSEPPAGPNPVEPIPKGTRNASPDNLPLIEKIAAFLQVAGPSSVNAIANGTGSKYQQVYCALTGRYGFRFRKISSKEWGLKS